MTAPGAAIPALVGREPELELLMATLSRGRSGEGAVVVVEGEAGIGKTRLLAEAAAHAQRLGFRCLRGSAQALEEGRPFGALRDALGLDRPTEPAGVALAKLVHESAASADARFLAQEAIVDSLEGVAEDGPLLVVLDDLHWSDRATLATIWALARRVDPLSLVVLLAARPAPRSAELDRVLTDCRDAGARALQLSSLSPEAVEALAADIVGADPAASVLEQLAGTRGNPFFVIEVLSAFVDEGVIDGAGGAAAAPSRGLPPELRASLLRRIGMLGTDAEEVLGVAAVLGSTFALDDLRLLLGRQTTDSVDVITGAVRAGILEERGDTLGFRHDLIREAVYEHFPQAVRTGLHRQAAAALGDRLEPSVRARHLVLGAASGDAAAVSGLRAAAAQLATRDPDAGAAVLEHAVSLEQGPVARAQLEAELARALLRAGRAREAEQRATDALATSGLPRSTKASLQLAVGSAMSHQGRMPAAVGYFRSAVDSGGLTDTERAYALARVAENTAWSFDLPAAWREGEAALAEGGRLGEPAVVTAALSIQCAVRSFEARFNEAILCGEAAVAAAGSDPDALRRTPHAYLGLALMGADRHDEARLVAEDGHRRSSALGQLLSLPNFHQLQARLAWFSGRWDDALAETDAAAALAADFGITFGVPANDAICGLVAFHRGDLENARGFQAQSRAAREQRGDPSGTELSLLLDALLAELDGNVEWAADLLVGLAHVMSQLGMRATQIWVGPEAVRLALAGGRHDAAVELADRLEKIAEVAHTSTARGAAAAARGLVKRDPDLLVTASAAYAAAYRPRDRLLACEWAGTALADTGRRDEGVNALQTAFEVATELDAVHDARRILGELRELGVRVGARGERRRGTTGWGALTDAEREVARLVGAGLGNAEIAERLFVSRRTVESHVSKLYAKLEARSRVTLAQVVRDQPAVAGAGEAGSGSHPPPPMGSRSR